MNRTAQALTFAMAFALLGCGASESEREKNGGEKGKGSAIEETTGTDDTSSLGQSLTSLFRDEIDFEIADLDGDIPCTPVEDRKSTVKNETVAWPAELRRFIVSYMKTMPIAEKLPEAIHGFYLVESKVLEQDVGGIACFRASVKKGAIFVNVRHAVDLREETGIGTYSQAEGVSDTYVLLEMRDLAASTIVHEAMHAVDFKFYQFGAAGEVKKREDLFDLSWAEYDKPKDAEKISILALNDAPAEGHATAQLAAGRRTYRGCPIRSYTGNGYGLTAASATKLAEELKYLAEDTNFIVPYTMANAIEDFAESLTVYHFLTRYEKADRRRVYDQDLTKVAPEDATLLYDADVIKIVEENAKQKSKLCEFAEIVFEEACKL